MASLTTFIHLTPEDRIVARNGSGEKPDYVTIDVVGEGGVAVAHLLIGHDQLPERIAELEAVVLALRNVVDDLIADDKAQEVEPESEMVFVSDLAPGRTIFSTPVGRWRQIDWIKQDYAGFSRLHFTDGGVSGWLSPNAAVRALVETPAVDAEAVGA